MALCRWGDLLAGWDAGEGAGAGLGAGWGAGSGDGGRSWRLCRRCCDMREGALLKRAAAPRLWADCSLRMVRWVRGEGGGLSSVVDEAKMWLLCGCARYGLKPSVDEPGGGMTAAEMMLHTGAVALLRCAVGRLLSPVEEEASVA